MRKWLQNTWSMRNLWTNCVEIILLFRGSTKEANNCLGGQTSFVHVWKDLNIKDVVFVSVISLKVFFKCLFFIGEKKNVFVFVFFSCPQQLNRWPCLSLVWSVPLTPLTIRVFTALQSEPRDLWPLRHLIRVMRRHDLSTFSQLVFFFFLIFQLFFFNFFKDDEEDKIYLVIKYILW